MKIGPKHALNAEDVKRLYDWHDPETYLWVVMPTESKVSLVLIILRAILLSIVGPFAVLWFVSFVSVSIAFWLGLIMAGFLIVMYPLMFLVGDSRDRFHLRNYRQIFCLSALGFYAYAFRSPGSFLQIGFSGATDSASWLFFLIDNTISTVTLDLSSIFGFQLSDISPQTPSAQFVTALFKLLLVSGLLDFLLVDLKVFFGNREFYATVKACYLRLDLMRFPAKRSWGLGRLGKVQMYMDIREADLTPTYVFMHALDSKAKDDYRRENAAAHSNK